jgi:tRNA1(Val) A37 N6-methylase TrmN6
VRGPADRDELTSDALTGSFRLLQRRGGHRFSVDDLATAWEAARARPAARSFVDLGCGVGAVLLMVAWRLPAARAVGIEAQEVSFALARRNVDENGLASRVTLVHDDLRHAARDLPPASFELVTGTPPYLPIGTALASPDPQRAAARIELRGGVEDYLAAAAPLLTPDGAVVVCADGRAPERVLRGAAAAGLVPAKRLDIVPRTGARAPLFAVWTCTPVARGALEHEVLDLRDERGDRTAASATMRGFFGLV